MRLGTVLHQNNARVVVASEDGLIPIAAFPDMLALIEAGDRGLEEAAGALLSRAEVLHEAEIVAIMSELLTKPEMEDGDDEDYAGYANKMRDAAREIVEGVKLNDYERARKAIGAVDQACTECHELYRA